MKNWIFPQVVTKIIIQSSSRLFQLQEVEGGEGWKCCWKTPPCRGYEKEQIQLNYYDRQQLLFVCWLKLTVHSRPWKQQLTKQSQLKVHLLTVTEVKVPWAEIVSSPAVSWIRNENLVPEVVGSRSDRQSAQVDITYSIWWMLSAQPLVACVTPMGIKPIKTACVSTLTQEL